MSVSIFKQVKWTFLYLVVCIFLCFWPGVLAGFDKDWVWVIGLLLAILIIVAPIAAFGNHFDQLSKEIGSVRTAVILYAELILNFGFTYFVIALLDDSDSHFKEVVSISVESIDYQVLLYELFNYIYFSVVTVSTIGYGDISPVSFYTKFLVIAEYFIGWYILVFVISKFIGGKLPDNKFNQTPGA